MLDPLLLYPVLASFCGTCVVPAPHDPDARIASLTKRIAMSPRDASLYLRRAQLHRQNRHFAAALSDLFRAGRLDRRLAAVDLVLARVRFDQRRLDESLTAVTRFLDKQSGSVAGRRLRATTLLGKGASRAAAREFEALLRLQRRPSPDDFIACARAMVRHADRRGATAILDRGIKRLGHLVSLHSFALDLEQESAAFAAALHRLDGLIARSRRRETWLCRRAAVLEKAGRPVEALAAFRAATAAIEDLAPRHRSKPQIELLATRSAAAIRRLTR